MNKLYFIMHENKQDYSDIVNSLIHLNDKNGFLYAFEPWITEAMPSVTNKIRKQQAEIICAIGGDGTLLRAGAVAIELGCPLLGINLGRVGFLTQADMKDLANVFQKLREEAFFYEERMVLQAQIGDRLQLALNDVVVNRGDYSKSIDLDVTVESEVLGRFIADGYIVSTPTGSTGYSLSAGGPIVAPDIDCILMTPVCAHSLQNRPLVISPKKTVKIAMHGQNPYKAAVSCDGRTPFFIGCDDEIRITQAKEKVRFIRFQSLHFLSLVKNKLNDWVNQ